MDSLGTVWVVCVIIYAINYGLSVVGLEMVMDFGPQSGTDARREGCPRTTHCSV